MIIVSSTTVDGAGSVKIRNFQNSGIYQNTSRISRVPTLDGSSHFDHFGVSDTDRDFSVDCRLSPGEFAILKAMFEGAEVVRISFWEGSFNGYIYRPRVDRVGLATIIFYFKEKLTA